MKNNWMQQNNRWQQDSWQQEFTEKIQNNIVLIVRVIVLIALASGRNTKMKEAGFVGCYRVIVKFHRAKTWAQVELNDERDTERTETVKSYGKCLKSTQSFV